ncbi:2-oxoacid:ferredoxin oxidoreductase subunit beta [Fonticella tunisiensis]|uniref:2-oxoglutarate ferredoxin oxidoreductase subunit beta n=1 Tax=Fonticella tunisiensis TaxID=1096341 RepID=A0A4R7KPQ4_9CLOT|nr:2-oxoacid:ferredoxin oxidoreductase subunit beta [Fonticella tunisiensis]TDT61119.1 2-oxoglutarate ferredoxin oxidoreductase subunit beta [Fonticella tunisiensis]
MLDIKLYNTNDENAWCPGCGNFSILDALKCATAELEIRPEDLVVVSGIGQAAKTPHYIRANGFNGLHGRALPPAQGIKMVNKNLKVIVTSGDGDSYGEGGNHFIHAIRRNMDITHLVYDNQIYGLTKGQGSPTTALGQKTTMQFEGVIQNPLNPLALAIASGATFVARTFTGDREGMIKILKEAIMHKGYSLVDILQPCVSFNKVNTFKWYMDRVYSLDESYDPTNKVLAFQKALEFGDDGIPVGVIYREYNKPIFEELHPVIRDNENVIDRVWNPQDAEKFIEEFM